MQIAFLGLGQIGGSVARAASAAGFASGVAAWTPGGAGPAEAAATGAAIVAAPTAAAAIRGADLVVLAAPPLACLDLLADLAGPLAADLAADAVITDVASTKGRIVARARDLGLRFVGGHPMAGREAAGYGAADPDLFRDRPWVIVPTDPRDAAAVRRVEDLATACGGRPLTMTADDHDAAVAAVSHLPLVLAAALSEAMTGEPDWPAAARLAAGGWASMTRLARGDAAMGAGIVATNARAISGRLVVLRAVLDDWIATLERDADPAALEARLRAIAATLGGPDEMAR